MRIEVNVPPVMDMICEVTPNILNILQVEELQRFEQAIENMLKSEYEPAFTGNFEGNSKKWCLIEGIARTLITIAQLMVIYRIDNVDIKNQVKQILEDDRWGFDG